LVVLEAKAAGLAIIGSRLGGIAELIREPDDGMLVSPGDVETWVAAITTMIANRKLNRRAPAPTQIRTMRDVADDMATVYRSLC
jgi:glycosyltransferase involved in cell wall biosynthesis